VALISLKKMFHTPWPENGLLIKWEKCNLVVKVAPRFRVFSRLRLLYLNFGGAMSV
jgi:hypothetical protein